MEETYMMSVLLLSLLTHSSSEPPPFTVAAYLPEWRFDSANYERICRTVNMLIFFSIEVHGNGTLAALDRLPRLSLVREARPHCKRMLLCVGGNGRSGGFSAAVSSRKSRRRFISALLRLCEKAGFDGVDYNWEYPGFAFGSGYKSEDDVARDYHGLQYLLIETREAYYPDRKQETMLGLMPGHPDPSRSLLGTFLQERMLGVMSEHVDAMHAMAYDQSGRHSTYAFAEKVAAQAVELLPPSKVTLGLPFYGRHLQTGDWKSYEDLMKPEDFPDGPSASLEADEAGGYYYNGPLTIARKVRLAASHGLQGVMVWEAGQDCREAPVWRHGKVAHVQTCPEQGPGASLLSAIRGALPPSSEGAGPHDEL